MATNENSNWDIRQLVLYHAKMSGGLFFGDDVLPNPESMYIALGHHNSFVVSPITLSNDDNAEHPFETVLNSSLEIHGKVNGNGSSMVIVAISDKENPVTNCSDEDTKALSTDVFWATDAPLMFCTLLHLPLDSSPMNEIMDDLSKWVNGLEDVYACCYWTIDCCDLILFVKSHSFQSGTNAIFSLSNDQLPDTKSIFLPISYAYTVWGIQHRYMFPKMNSSWDERLQNVQIRATVQSLPSFIYVVKKILNEQGVEEKQYFCQGLFGDQDISIHFPEIQSQLLLTILQSLFLSLYENDVLIALHTQIGTDNLPKQKKPQEHETNIMRTAALNLLFEMKKLMKNPSTKAIWVTPVYELLNKLVQMSDSGVYDDIFFQLYLPAQVFTEQIRIFIQYSSEAKALENYQERIAPIIENFYLFIRGWHSVMHLSMRADVQLVQAPGRLPILYELPAKLCEFYASFTHLISSYYQSKQPLLATKDRSFIIVPRLSTRVSTRVVFNFDFPPQKRLVFCDLPTSMIFHVSQAMVILAHEVAHFSGQSTCFRSLRLRKIVHCMAALICENIGIAKRLGFTDQQKTTLIDKIYDKLHDESLIKIEEDRSNRLILFDIEEFDDEGMGYQTEQCNAVESAMDDLFVEPFSIFCNEVISVCENVDRKTVRTETRKSIKEFFENDGKSLLSQWIEFLRELVFESYADCAAIFTLDLRPEEFYSAICFADPFETIEDVKKACEKSGFGLRMMMANELFYTRRRTEDQPTDEVLKQLLTFSRSRSRLKKNSPSDIIFSHLKEYLKPCLEDMGSVSKGPNNKEKFANLRAVYNDIARDHSISKMQSQFNKVLRDYWLLVKRRASEFK